MSSSWNPFRRLYNSTNPIPAGNYHYQSPPDDPRNYRLHLRLEPHGGGVLVVNAATILHLNQTAAEYAYFIVHNTPDDEVATRMAARYEISKTEARQDYRELAEKLQILVETPDLDPNTFLDFERRQPLAWRISAPYRLDCALTYRLPAEQSPDSAPIERVARELSTAEWRLLLEKAWAAGVPHVVFTGGEPTLRNDLPELVACAEQLGMVAGLTTDGHRLADELYLDRLLKAGLDHLLLVLEPDDEQSWQAVGNSLVEDLSVAVHLTLNAGNAGQIPAALVRLSNLGARKLSLSAVDPALAGDLQTARDKAAFLGLELIWNLPVPYSALNPIVLETGADLPEGAGRAWLYVEPDGDVRPAQGHPQILGNLHTSAWSQVWKP